MDKCAPVFSAVKEQVKDQAGHTDVLVPATVMAHMVALRSQMDVLAQGQEKIHKSVAKLQQDMKVLGSPLLHGMTMNAGLHLRGPEGGVTAPPPGQSQVQAETAARMERPSANLSEKKKDVEKHEEEEDKSAEMEGLKALILKAEEEEERILVESNRTPVEKVLYASKDIFELLIDSVTGVMILTNACFIGIAVDWNTDDGVGWKVIDIFYSICFLSELILKLKIHGFREHFCGKEGGSGIMSNWFDLLVVMSDLVQLFIDLFLPTVKEDMKDSPSSSLLRMMRLLRLGRILRLLKMNAFKDFVTMTSGIVGALPTLGWAGLLFILFIYVFALIFRETIGRQPYFDGVSDYFDTVPRAMFTIFRCSFGDCSTHGGLPLFEHVATEMGELYMYLYSAFIFFFTVGLFNVISAIFVESTMSAATAQELKDKQARLADDNLWCTRIATLIRCVLRHAHPEADTAALSSYFEEVQKIALNAHDFTAIVMDDEAASALDELDISRDDHRYLADILDPDNGGSLSIQEIVDGLMRLRGEPRRSDIVAVDLMVRSLQRDVRLVLQVQKEMKFSIKENSERLEIIGLERLGR